MRLTDEEGLPLEGAADGDGRGVNLVGVSAEAEGKVDAEQHEKCEGDDLEDETSNHDIDSDLSCVVVVGGGSKAATAALEDEREEVAADEDEGIGPGLDSRGAFSIHDDDAGEAEIDGGSQESGAECQADEISDNIRTILHISGRKTYSRNGLNKNGLK